MGDNVKALSQSIMKLFWTGTDTRFRESPRKSFNSRRARHAMNWVRANWEVRFSVIKVKLVFRMTIQ